MVYFFKTLCSGWLHSLPTTMTQKKTKISYFGTLPRQSFFSDEFWWINLVFFSEIGETFKKFFLGRSSLRDWWGYRYNWHRFLTFVPVSARGLLDELVHVLYPDDYFELVFWWRMLDCCSFKELVGWSRPLHLSIKTDGLVWSTKKPSVFETIAKSLYKIPLAHLWFSNFKSFKSQNFQ